MGRITKNYPLFLTSPIIYKHPTFEGKHAFDLPDFENDAKLKLASKLIKRISVRTDVLHELGAWHRLT